MGIVEEIQNDREKGAKRLESEYRAGLMTLALRLCHDSGDAAELVNRTFAEVIAGIDDYAEQSAFFGWMSKILVNIHAKDVRRKSNAEIVYPGDVPEVADENAQENVFRNIEAEELREAIETLPEAIRKTLMLHYFMDLSVAEVAKILTVPSGTVKRRLHCARQILAAKLGAAAKKPGGKALLTVIALCAFAAAGVAGIVAIRAATAGKAECTMLNAQCTMNDDALAPEQGADGQLPSRQTIEPSNDQATKPSDCQTVQPSNQQEQEEPTMNKRTLIAASAAFLAAGMPNHAVGTPQRYATVTVAGYTGENALTNFPVLVRVSPSRIPGFSYSDCAAGGADIAFIDADGNVLVREIDTWNPEGESLVWVSVPVLTNRTAFTMTYKNPAMARQPACQTNGAVWAAADYVGVWHFGESAGTAFDATTNALHGTVFAPEGQEDLAENCVGVDAKVGKGRYTPAAVYLKLPNFSHLNVAGTLTLSGWYRITEEIPSNSSPMMFHTKSIWDSKTDGWYVCLQWSTNSDTTKKKLGMNGAGNQASVAMIDSVQNWVHVTAVFSNKVGIAYSNGNWKGSYTLRGAAMKMTATKIPTMFNGNFAGDADEVRLRFAANDDDWVKAEYQTVSSDAFLSYSQAERIPRHGMMIILR